MRVLADVFKVMVEMRSLWIKVGPKFNEIIFMRQKRRRHRDINRRKEHVKIEARVRATAS